MAAVTDADDSLLVRFAEGDPEGFLAFYRRHLPAALGFFLRRTAHRDAVLARVVDERPYTEIAAEMRCSEMLVRQRVSRGLRTLRADLTKEER